MELLNLTDLDRDIIENSLLELAAQLEDQAQAAKSIGQLYRFEAYEAGCIIRRQLARKVRCNAEPGS